MPASRDTFTTQLDALRDHIRSAQAHLKTATEISTRLGAPGVTPCVSFFYQTVAANTRAALLNLYKVTDKAKGTVTVERFLAAAKKSPGVFGYAAPDRIESMIQKDQDRLAEIHTTLEGLRTRRNEADVHLSRVYTADRIEWEKRQSVKAMDVGPTLDVLEEVVDRYYKLLWGSTPSPSSDFYPSIEQDVAALFANLGGAANPSPDVKA